MPTVLFLGATGYIGGSVLVALARAYPDITLKALVRPSKFKSATIINPIEATGAQLVSGYLKDYDLVSHLASQSDIIINTADSDDSKLLEALLRAMKRRKEETNNVGSFIQTSGAMIFLEGNTSGEFDPGSKVWTDKEDDIRRLTTSMFHGEVDVPLMKASEEEIVNSFIICPSAVFGIGHGSDRKVAWFFPSVFLEKGLAFYVGKGSSVFGTVHIKDLVSLYGIVFERALSAFAKGSPLKSSPFSRYYVASTGERPLKSIAEAYGRELYKRGVLSSPEAKSVAYEDAGKYKEGFSNMRLRPENGRSIGWEPEYIVSDETMMEGIEDYLERRKQTTAL